MRVLLLDRFDVISEPQSVGYADDQIYYVGDVDKLKNHLLHSSKLLDFSDIIIFISFNKNNQRNFNYKILYNNSGNEQELIGNLQNIYEKYAYLYDLSKATEKKLVNFDIKIFVGEHLIRLTDSHQRGYSLVGSWRHNLRYSFNRKFYSFLNYKFYFIIMDAWEKFWMAVLGAVIGVAIVLVVNNILSDKKTIRYELGDNNQIDKIIDNAPDESVMNTTNMSSKQILQLIDSLNATLKKYPDSPKTK